LDPASHIGLLLIKCWSLFDGMLGFVRGGISAGKRDARSLLIEHWSLFEVLLVSFWFVGLFLVCWSVSGEESVFGSGMLGGGKPDHWYERA